MPHCEESATKFTAKGAELRAAERFYLKDWFFTDRFDDSDYILLCLSFLVGSLGTSIQAIFFKIQ